MTPVQEAFRRSQFRQPAASLLPEFSHLAIDFTSITQIPTHCIWTSTDEPSSIKNTLPAYREKGATTHQCMKSPLSSAGRENPIMQTRLLSLNKEQPYLFYHKNISLSSLQRQLSANPCRIDTHTGAHGAGNDAGTHILALASGGLRINDCPQQRIKFC